MPGFRSASDSRTYWFSRRGCVVLHESGLRDVYVGAALVGRFEPGDLAMRNLLLVTVASDKTVVFEDLARAFGVVSETVRLIRREYEANGLLAVVVRKERKARRPQKLTPALRAKVKRLFEAGHTQTETRAKLKGALSKGTLNKLHQEWTAAQLIAEAAMKDAPRQVELSLEPEASAAELEPEPPSTSPPGTAAMEPAVTGALVVKKEESGYVVRAPETASVDARTVPVSGPASQRRVQFLGAWLLVAMTARLGLHAAVASESAKRGSEKALRMAVDAVTVALGIGEACVEGVRRLAHTRV